MHKNRLLLVGLVSHRSCITVGCRVPMCALPQVCVYYRRVCVNYRRVRVYYRMVRVYYCRVCVYYCRVCVHYRRYVSISDALSANVSANSHCSHPFKWITRLLLVFGVILRSTFSHDGSRSGHAVYRCRGRWLGQTMSPVSLTGQ
jgi:hypothetical protein